MPDVTIPIDTSTTDGYRLFVKCKDLPTYKVIGSSVITDDLSYNHVFGGCEIGSISHNEDSMLFDYQNHILNNALKRERYAVFADCGLGKTRIELAWAHDVAMKTGKKILILCPLAVMEDQQRESETMYGCRMSNLRKESWSEQIAIMNFEGMKEIDMRGVGGVVLDESSILKNGDGKIRKYLTEMVSNVRYRLACSATPSPNDQSEYATHAVWLNYASTLKEYYSRYFRKDGTIWIMKQHATDAFYSNLSSWACYIKSPYSLGFERGAELDCEPNYIIQRSFTSQEYMPDGKIFADAFDLSDASRVFTRLRSDKSQDRFKVACDSIAGKRAIVWCNRNAEEAAFKSELAATTINGSTPIESRVEIIDAFRTHEIDIIVSKPKVLGFGVNMPQAEAHLFSGYTFSFEEFYQAVRRSHRYGRKGRLDVVVPVSEPETPVWSILQRKLDTFEKDVLELQSRFFGEGHPCAKESGRKKDE
jgi:hypothetical protein